MNGQNLTGVTELLTGKHVDPIMSEGLHAHVWTVTVFYPMEPFRDGRALKASLRVLLDTIPNPDGSLPVTMWSGEAIARSVVNLLAGCVGAHVSRPEGFEVWFWL